MWLLYNVWYWILYHYTNTDILKIAFLKYLWTTILLPAQQYTLFITHAALMSKYIIFYPRFSFYQINLYHLMNKIFITPKKRISYNPPKLAHINPCKQNILLKFSFFIKNSTIYVQWLPLYKAKKLYVT